MTFIILSEAMKRIRPVMASFAISARYRSTSAFDSPVPPSVHQTISGRKRFYKHVSIEQVEENQNLYKIMLDGKTLKTPGRHSLHLPNKELALAIACEWDAQGVNKGIQPTTMPLMILASTAIDQISVNPEFTKSTCLKYLPTDTSLFYANNEDRILLKKQRQYLQPLVRWIHKSFEIQLSTTQSMSNMIKHPDESVNKVKWMLDQLDPFSLACIQCVTIESKSLVMAIAYFCRYLSLDQIKVSARIEEEFQVEIWGLVEGGHDLDRLNCGVNLASAGLFLGLLHSTEELNRIMKMWENGPSPM